MHKSTVSRLSNEITETAGLRGKTSETVCGPLFAKLNFELEYFLNEEAVTVLTDAQLHCWNGK